MIRTALINNFVQTYEAILKDCAQNHDVTVSSVISYTVTSTKNGAKLSYNLSNGKSLKISKRFSGRRSAKEYGDRRCRNVLIADITFTPIKPLEYITINFEVSNVN